MRRPTVKAASGKTLAHTTPSVLSSAAIRLMTPPGLIHLQSCKHDADAEIARRRTGSARARIAVRGPMLRVAVITRQRCSHYTADASRSRRQSTREYPLTRIVCTDSMTRVMIGNIAALWGPRASHTDGAAAARSALRITLFKHPSTRTTRVSMRLSAAAAATAASTVLPAALASIGERAAIQRVPRMRLRMLFRMPTRDCEPPMCGQIPAYAALSGMVPLVSCSAANPSH